MSAAGGLPMIGGFFNALGAKQTGDATIAADMHNYNNNILNANEALQQSAESERRQQVYSSQVIGSAQANYGASGVSGSSGSALDVLQSSAANAALDSLKIKHAGDMKAYAYRSGAQLDQMGADSAQKAENISAVSSIFGGMSQTMPAATSGGQMYSGAQ